LFKAVTARSPDVLISDSSPEESGDRRPKVVSLLQWRDDGSWLEDAPAGSPSKDRRDQ
jgi:hypothetical protein